MESVTQLIPIWIAKTKSWWFGMVPAVLLLIDFIFQQLDSEQAIPFANAIALIMNLFGADLTGADINTWLRGVAPFYVAVVIMYQRRGINRPYSATPAKEHDMKLIVENGLDAFEFGKKVGRELGLKQKL